jgi:hypothetical protein
MLILRGTVPQDVVWALQLSQLAELRPLVAPLLSVRRILHMSKSSQLWEDAFGVQPRALQPFASLRPTLHMSIYEGLRQNPAQSLTCPPVDAVARPTTALRLRYQKTGQAFLPFCFHVHRQEPIVVSFGS